MSGSQPPPEPRKLTVRDGIGALSAMFVGFGMYSWFAGREIPWGAQQTGGAIGVGIGVIGLVAYWLWPRSTS